MVRRERGRAVEVPDGGLRLRLDEAAISGLQQLRLWCAPAAGVTRWERPLGLMDQPVRPV